MKRNQAKIDAIIKKSKIMSLGALKSELKIEKDISLISILMKYMLVSINDIDYSTDIVESGEVLRTLYYIKPKNESEFVLVEEYIKELKKQIAIKKETLQNNENIL